MPCTIEHTDLRNSHDVFAPRQNRTPTSRPTDSFTALVLACAFILFTGAALQAQTYQDLYDFACSTGCEPFTFAHLTQGIDGDLYGTTAYGGPNGAPNGDGVIFKFTTLGAYTVLWNFDGTSTGANPTSALTLASFDGNFYGTAYSGGSFNSGTLFRFNPSSNVVTVLHHFTTAEGFPNAPPVEAKDANLYGMTSTGTTYRLTVATGTYAALPNKTPGLSYDPLFLASDGNLYGATYTGGKKNLGTIFGMTTAGKIQTIHSFAGPDGAAPIGALTQGKDGNLYGTTSSNGGSADAGTVFKITLPPAPILTTLHSFNGTDGSGSITGLLAATDGNLYGTTEIGGTNSAGTIFDISGGVFNKLFDFAGDGGVGAAGFGPVTTLMEDTNGVFYGLTYAGGVDDQGVFYSLTPLNLKVSITLCCNYWVILDQPVKILGTNLTGVVGVAFGSVAAQFQPGSDTYLIADVPSLAVDGPVIVTLATGLQIQSQQNAHILPTITNLDPSSGRVGSQVNITGGGFTGAKKVSFGGVLATSFAVVTPALIQATVPTGAKTGKVSVVTPNGSALSKKTFTVD